jgi:beta-ureidopropionase / N-carbamoyl-L-amino-acid hydrolase
MPAPNVLEINPGRLWETLERSAEIGRFRDVGLRRLALSAEDKQMRDLFVDWAKKAGCRDRSPRQYLRAARRQRCQPAAGRDRQPSRHPDLRRPL